MNGHTPREDRYTGCMLGGAVGDALGSAVEFMNYRAIARQYGPGGIRDLAPGYHGLGTITDDTQMTLFTAEGLLEAAERSRERGTGMAYKEFLHGAYLRWLSTQGYRTDYPEYAPTDSLLLRVPELHHRRAPGGTVISALSSGKMGSMECPMNDSKGCGGIMRAAPVGFAAPHDPFRVGCESAAITHGHPSGYLSAGFITAVIYVLSKDGSLTEAIAFARAELAKYLKHEECLAAVDRSIELARTMPPSQEAISRLGEGWVGEEALAISLYCSLTAVSFEEAVILAVNHDGDSDSTGAITGNILGTAMRKQAIPERWLKDLEIRDVIEQMGRDLFNCFGGPESSA